MNMTMKDYAAQVILHRMVRNNHLSLMAQFVKAQNRIVEDEVSRNFHKWSGR